MPVQPTEWTVIKRGTRFRSIIADANVLFEVTGKAGRGVWRAKATADNFDYAGEVRAFTEAQILHAVGIEAYFKKAQSDDDRFYAELALGSIVHYHNAFGAYVRCEVVRFEGPNPPGHRELPIGCHALKPIALVGEWKAWDLPRRRPDGTIESGYHVTSIAEGHVWRPSATCVYEHPDFADRRAVVHGLCRPAPSTLPALDLSLPDPDPAAAERAALEKDILAIREVLATPGDPTERLRRARDRIEEALHTSTYRHLL